MGLLSPGARGAGAGARRVRRARLRRRGGANFHLAPQFFDRSKFGTKPLTFPDRVRLTVEAIRGGKHAMFLGGWLSFNGEMRKGGWGRTGLRTILPVTCLDVEELVESTKGSWPEPSTPAIRSSRA